MPERDSPIVHPPSVVSAVRALYRWRVNAIESLDAIRAQLQEQDDALTSSLEALERDREIVRRQLALAQELAELQERRVASGARLERVARAEPVAQAEPEPVATAEADAEPARPDAEPEPETVPAVPHDPGPTPLARAPWPRAAGEPDTGLLRRMRAS